VYAPLDGYNPGHVYVNDLQDPRSTCVLLGDPAYTGDIFLGGNPGDAEFNGAVRAPLDEVVVPSMLAEEGEGHIMLYTVAEGWRDVLDVLLASHGVKRLVRTVFALDREAFAARHAEWRERVPEGHRVVRADRPLAEQIPGAAELWGSVDHFLERGFGFCVLRADEMLSRCQPVFIGDGRAELGVGTVPDHRRRGLATLAACACIEHCLSVGLEPEWGCFHNEASGALARRLGFVKQADLDVHYVRAERAAAEGEGG